VRTAIGLADVIRIFGDRVASAESFTSLQGKVLGRIAYCRTAVLGGHEQVCRQCGTVRYSYNSCGDRHCPTCQAARQAFWIEDLMHSTLPVRHFHLVFTVPHQLNTLCLYNNRMYYDILFDAVWHTLRTFGYTRHGVETGALCVLHTWGQNLSLHPHLHCIVPEAGYSLKGEWKAIGNQGLYLYPVQQLSVAFKATFLGRLKRALAKRGEAGLFSHAVQQAYNTNWVVYCEPSLASSEQVVRYLGQYTHRVAITNNRILRIADGKGTFMAKDYRDRAVKKPVTLDGVEFLRRFTLHILPHRFVKIRRYGIYNHTLKRNLALRFFPEEKPDIEALEKRLSKEQARVETSMERFERLTGINPCRCPVCKTGRMVTIRTLPRIRSPGGMAARDVITASISATQATI
jgi:hypothetical protein